MFEPHFVDTAITIIRDWPDIEPFDGTYFISRVLVGIIGALFSLLWLLVVGMLEDLFFNLF